MHGPINTEIKGQKLLRIEEFHFSASRNVLVLAPHPDDFDAIGVTMRFLKEAGHRIFLGVATSGINGIEDGWNGVFGSEEKASIREAEQLESCAFFGLVAQNVRFLRLWEASGSTSDDSLREYILSINPDFVFMPHGNDSNRTHRQTYEAFVRIAHQESLQACLFLNLDAKTISMRHDIYTFFGEELAAWKAKLLRFHESQQHRNRVTRGCGFDERILALNREAARAKGDLPYAEVFEVQYIGIDNK